MNKILNIFGKTNSLKTQAYKSYVYLKICFIVLLTLVVVKGLGQTTDLIISEYVEGSSNNKYIELYNGTGSDVNLGDYRLRLYANGSATPTQDVLLSGTLTNGTTIVYKNSLATIYGGAATNNAAVAFNGDDAVALYKISTSSNVDIFGNIGCDPGTAWTATNTTLDKTLVRNASICGGVSSDDATSCPFPTLAADWTQFNIDDVSNLGTHTATCSGCTSPTTQASSFSTNTITAGSMNFAFTRGNGDGGVLVIAKSGGAPTDPVSGTTYNANSVYGSGDACGGGFVVYNGTAAGVSTPTGNLPVTGLSANTTYYFAVYEYNTTGTCYNLTELTGNATTLCAEPSTQASSITFSSVTSSSMTVNWTRGGTPGDGVIVLGKSGSVVDSDPVDGTLYTANAAFGSGTQIGTGNYVVFFASGTSVNVTGLAASTTYYFKVFEKNCSGTTSNYYITTPPSNNQITAAPAPEINVKQGVTSYLSGGASYDFGSVVWGSNSSDITFTIENTGDANLTFSTPLGTSGDFSVQVQPVSPVAGSGSTTFTVRFTPAGVGIRNGSVVITNNDADEGTYTLNLTGTGTPSNLSDIIANVTYSYNSNIDYSAWQTAAPLTNTSQCIDLFKIDIRDGGAVADADNLPTILTDITFNVTNISLIRTAALFNGNTLVNNSPVINVGGGTIAFSGLSGADVTASDGSSNNLTLRVSFLSAVTDNAQIQVTISEANVTEAGSSTSSLFTSFSNVVSSTTGDRNRIEVTATVIIWGTQPANGEINTNLAVFTINAADAYGNTDLDNSSCTVALTTSGTGFTSTSPYTFSSGVISVSDVQYNALQTGITITGTAQSCLGSTVIVSGSFNITGITPITGDWRPKMDGVDFSWADNPLARYWEKFDGSSWVAQITSPQGDATTPTRIVINKTGVVAGGNTTNDYNDIVIINGGELICNDYTANPVTTFINSTKSLEVLNGGTLKIQGNFLMASDANLIVRSGGTMIINEPNMENDEEIWSGVENFEAGSYVEYQDWSWSSGSTVACLINITSTISDNSNGYKFGYFKLNSTTVGTNHWTLVGGGVGIINLCYNDLTIITNGTGYVGGVSNKTGTNGFVVNGNLIINSGNFCFGSSYSADAFSHQVTINGNFEFNGSGTLKTHRANTVPSTLTGFVNFKGNVTVASAATFSNDKATDNSKFYININGSGTSASPQLINIGCVNTGTSIYVQNNTFAKLKSNNLSMNGIASTTTAFTLESGSSLHFGWADDGTTPLIITTNGTGTNTFTSQTLTNLYITHSGGIDDGNNPTTSNIQQFAVSNRSIDQQASFWYVGKENQVTGIGLIEAPSPAGRQIIVDMLDDSKTLTLSTKLEVSNNTGVSATGGKLDIRKGTVVETTSSYFKSTSGTLYMTGGIYRVVKLSIDASDLIPRMNGVTFAYNLTGGTVELNGGAGNQYLRGQRDYYSLMFSGGGTKYISDAVSDIGDNVTINSGLVTIKDASTILDVINNTFSGNAGLTMTDASLFRMSLLNQTLPQLLGNYTMTGGTVELYGTSSAQTHSIRGTDGSSNNITYNNIELNSSAANVGIDAANIVVQAGFSVNGTLNLNSPSCFKIGSGFNISGTGNVIVKTGSTLKYGNEYGITASSTNPVTGGNIINSGTRTFPSTASYGFCGGVDQVTGDGLPATVRNLYVDKTDNSKKVSLSQDVTVASSYKLTFTGGKLELGTKNITITSTGTSVGTDYIQGYDSDKYIITNTVYNDSPKGFLIREVGATWDTPFPIGISSSYNPCMVEMWGGSRNFSCRVFPGVYSHGISGSLMETPIVNYVNRTWEITPASTVGITDATVQLQWNGSDEGGSFTRANSKMIKNLGGGADDWAEVPASAWDALNVGSAPYTIKAGNITTFSKFAIKDNEAVLPIGLLSFNAMINGLFIDVLWSTYSEINNDYFNVEHSNDGFYFTDIFKIYGAGNSNNLINYKFIDIKPVKGVNYYRLKQTDFDGKFSYSKIIAIDFNNHDNFSFYNLKSESGIISFQVNNPHKTSFYVQITDILGRILYNNEIETDSANPNIVISDAVINQGIYFLMIYNKEEKYSSKFLKY